MVLIKLTPEQFYKGEFKIFTFQYGSNQIVLFPVSSTPLIWFTFQYGSNQIKYNLITKIYS